MSRPFLEAFPSLKLDGEMLKIFGDVEVEKISATKRQDLLRIYITSKVLIEKEHIYQAEKEIKRQLFPSVDMVIKIYEKVILSAQYNPQNLLEMYMDSILLEIKNYDPIEHIILKKADFGFPEGDVVKITLEDTAIAKKKAKDIARVFEKGSW